MSAARRRHFYKDHDLVHDCKICKRSQKSRKQWGCDEESKKHQIIIPCVRCHGEDPDCPDCKDTEEDIGQVRIYRCPNAIARSAPWIQETLWLHSLWPDNLPLEGSLYDQTSRYINLMRVCDHAAHIMEDTDRKILEEKMKRNK